MEDCRSQCQAEKWLQELQLADGSDTALRQPFVPEHKSDQHAEQGNIGETDPRRHFYLRKGRWHDEE